MLIVETKTSKRVYNMPAGVGIKLYTVCAQLRFGMLNCVLNLVKICQFVYSFFHAGIMQVTSNRHSRIV